MKPNDLKKLLTGRILISLDRIITPKLITLFYVLGLATIGLWAFNHVFFAFRFGFGNGVWGLLESAIFGSFAWLLLRVISEILLMFFQTNEHTVAEHNAQKRLLSTPSLIEEVTEAIEDLAREDENSTPDTVQQSTASVSANKPATPTRRSPPRRTAKRSPKSNKS